MQNEWKSDFVGAGIFAGDRGAFACLPEDIPGQEDTLVVCIRRL